MGTCFTVSHKLTELMTYSFIADEEHLQDLRVADRVYCRYNNIREFCLIRDSELSQRRHPILPLNLIKQHRTS